jgi:hypothetical protein
MVENGRLAGIFARPDDRERPKTVESESVDKKIR